MNRDDPVCFSSPQSSFLLLSKLHTRSVVLWDLSTEDVALLETSSTSSSDDQRPAVAAVEFDVAETWRCMDTVTDRGQVQLRIRSSVSLFARPRWDAKQ